MTGQRPTGLHAAVSRDTTSPPGVIYIIRQPTSYADAWDLQTRLHEERAHNARPDTVLILEHLPVYTLGRSTRPAHWGGNAGVLRENGAELHSVNRGGSVTYHGPGQIVMYPVLRLIDHAAGPRQFVWHLEEVIIRLLKRWAIDGRRIDKKPGVWVLDTDVAKVASVGIRIEQGVTLHGCAVNVDMDLAPFHLIHPCGLSDCRVTTMAAHTDTPVLQDIKVELAHQVGDVFAGSWSTVIVDTLGASTLSLSGPHAGT